jgi:hypothetical protein
MSSWQKVYEDTIAYRAEMVKAILEENDLQAIVLNKKDTAYQFGDYEVLVHPDAVLKAIKIINEEINFE